jgi:ATP-dependent DNA helicase RecQ
MMQDVVAKENAMPSGPPAGASGSSGPWSVAPLLQVIERHWGYRTLRPLQEQAMRAVLEGRDSLVVLPTGGGKSLCYQAPSVLRNDTTVVVSPLISLMKDQVDSLRACGVPAIQLDSSQSAAERFANEIDIQQGGVRLVFVSPERLVQTDFYKVLQRIGVRAFAIDEAHCISHWGHDFRPEYRQLNRLHEFFPSASVHAYTATATERVRRDIIQQLGLRDPEVLVGNFDRPNLVYRVVPRRDLLKQALQVIDRHPGEAGIIYCIRKADVNELTAALQGKGHKALPYHADLSGEERKANQEAFLQEKCDLIVATVAFGMGIDRPNIRFVLHAAMPKSIEHYQQESGRAGRDGLEAECVLLYSGSDALLWKAIVEKSAEEAGAAPEFVASAVQHMNDMDRYCRGANCRHAALVRYFGQGYEAESCDACDLCLGETEDVLDAQVVAQKILSCVARLRERFGVGHVIAVLRGQKTERVTKFRHDQLSTYGLLKEHGQPDVRDWIYQLIGQAVLVQTDDEYPVLRLNAASWQVMRGERTVRLVQLARGRKHDKAPVDAASWEGVDRVLFEALRRLRLQVAEERTGGKAHHVFSDSTLRLLARIRPSTKDRMRSISGIGDAKLRDFGDRFLQVILDQSRQRGLTLDNVPAPVPVLHPSGTPAAPAKAPLRPNAQRTQAFGLFRTGAMIEDVMHQTGRSRSTIVDYLCDYIREERPGGIRPWVSDAVYQRVAAAARQFGVERLKPIFIALGEQVSYDDIRLVLAHLSARA